MAVSQNELSPQFARLFYVAGLLEKSEWDVYGKRHQKHKPILDVLTQTVSLNTFKDLLNAEITLKSQVWSRDPESMLHQGLTASIVINEDELRTLLGAWQPELEPLLESLAGGGGELDPETLRRTLETHAGNPENDADWALTAGLISAQGVGHWLTQHETPQIRLAALFLSLYILRHNGLLSEGDFARCAGLLAPAKLDELLHEAREHLGLTSGWIADRLENRLTLPEVQPAGLTVDQALLARFPETLVRRQMMIPFTAEGGRLALATSDPLNIALTALIHWITGAWPLVYFAPGGQIIERINRLFSPAAGAPEGNGTAAPSTGRPSAAAQPSASDPSAPATTETPARAPRRETDIVVDNMSAVQLVSSLIESAIEMQTTDIHIEPVRAGLLIRFRIDGELHRIMTIPPSLAQSVISRVKVLASMDVTERRRPQDGHFDLRVDTHTYDFRISSLPAIQGEKVVIRILDEQRVQTGLDNLGLMSGQQRAVEKMLGQPYGLILVTGPTGSGKTSTLYAALNVLNRENRNLVTIEDPIEYQIEGINQVQVDPHIGLTFSEGLRSILRQDPDVIMVGEVRDPDTAHNALRAALTGHLVFSTLHTNVALGAIDALVHLGCAPFMVAGSLIGILSQRLLRKLCLSCRKPMMTNPIVNQQLGLDEGVRKRIYTAGQCDDCLKTGYLGRTGVFEVIRVHDALRPLITQRKLIEVERLVREKKVPSLAEASAQKVIDGGTSVEEVMRKVIFEN